MGLQHSNLDEETRALMVEEIETDIADHTIYVSRYLTELGAQAWPELTIEAARNGSDDSLAAAVRQPGRLRTHTERRKPSGGFTMAAVPYNAHETMAESQFNLYVMRALARRAIASGQALQVFRGKAVDQPRASSEALIGSTVDPKFLLDELRRTKGVEPRTDMPLPNSGLCIRLV